MPILETQNLVKRYGSLEALRGVSLAVEPGEIFGLLGQNGAGKTTLIKVLLGITGVTGGEAKLLDSKAGSTAVRSRVGYLPEDHRFPDYHTGYTLCEFYSSLIGVPRSQRRKRIPETLELVGLKDRMHSKIRTYSKGMKQRVGLAQAMIHDPEIIFLDEPTDGVDPLGRREIRKVMQQLKERGKTVFLNSHMLGEVELICDRVCIMNKGQIVTQGDVATLTRRKNTFVVGLGQGGMFPTQEAQALGYTVKPDGALWAVELKDDQTIDPVVDLLRSKGLNLRHLVEKRDALEDIYLTSVGTNTV